MFIAIHIKRTLYGAMPHTHDIQSFIIAISNLSFQVMVLTILEYAFSIKDKYHTLAMDYKRNEILSLKQKSKPHFIYNTLNLIATEIKPRPALAEELIYDLSELMRRITNLESDYHFLSDEIKIIEKYLNIQTNRFGERISLDINIDSESNRINIPPLLVLPLVENAFKHGISPSNHNNFISLSSNIAYNQLKIEVKNNISHDLEKDFKIGNGLESIKSQLEFNYPENHEFTIHRNNNIVSAEIIIKNIYDNESYHSRR